MQKQHFRLLVLTIIILLAIGFIMWRTGQELEKLEEKMPVIGCSTAISTSVLIADNNLQNRPVSLQADFKDCRSMSENNLFHLNYRDQ